MICLPLRPSLLVLLLYGFAVCSCEKPGPKNPFEEVSVVYQVDQEANTIGFTIDRKLSSIEVLRSFDPLIDDDNNPHKKVSLAKLDGITGDQSTVAIDFNRGSIQLNNEVYSQPDIRGYLLSDFWRPSVDPLTLYLNQVYRITHDGVTPSFYLILSE